MVWYSIFTQTDIIFCLCLRVEQVQEKKVKKISEMNVDPTKVVGNGSLASSSNSTSSPKQYLANGGYPDRSCPSNDFPIPAGGIPSLHLPVVFVLNPLY